LSQAKQYVSALEYAKSLQNGGVVFSDEEIHDEELKFSSLVVTSVDDPRDVPSFHLGCQPRLQLEAGFRVGIGQTCHLHCPVTLCAGIEDLVDSPHGAFADQLFDLVATVDDR